MINTEVVVVDYGMGNLLSVRRGFEHCGATVNVTADPQVILSAPRVVLPGVGAFMDGMAALKNVELDKVLLEVASLGTPLLGICLGMQMLLDESEEFGKTHGLGLIPGKVIAVPSTTTDGQFQKTPHIGWSALTYSAGRSDWSGTLMQAILPGDAAYFVHSFMASPSNSEHRVADCIYGGRYIAATIQHKNVMGCQFHPEKSGETGLKVLRQFLAL